MIGTGRLLLVLLSMILLASADETRVSDTMKAQLVQGNNRFALELYSHLKTQEGNLFFSPYSISSALAMTYAGARGNTEKQMARVLHFELGQERLHPTFHALNDELEVQTKQQGCELNIANALWGQKGYRFFQDFLNLSKTYYGAGFHTVDFISAVEAARQVINTWIEKETNGKIKNLIKRGTLNDYTRLVLTNAIYFKGNWPKQFAKEQTRDAPFYVSAEKTVKVPMMSQKGNFKLMETPKTLILELPYKGNELSMVILLPKKVDGLTKLENSLTIDTLKKWLGNLNHMNQEEVIVNLPKFKLISEFRVDGMLASMGMPDAFSLPPADFTGITGDSSLFISAVIHKAFVDVNEEGTEAAAATAVVEQTMGISPYRNLIFRADHPFLFLIRDLRSGSILFLGRVMNPLE